jgi:hypothetical protein
LVVSKDNFIKTYVRVGKSVSAKRRGIAGLGGAAGEGGRSDHVGVERALRQDSAPLTF